MQDLVDSAAFHRLDNLDSTDSLDTLAAAALLQAARLLPLGALRDERTAFILLHPTTARHDGDALAH